VEHWFGHSHTAFTYADTVFATHEDFQTCVDYNRLRCQFAYSDSLWSTALGGESLGRVGPAREILWGLHYLLVSIISAETANGMHIDLVTFFRSQVEINTAIICASAPSIQPLIKHVVSKFCPFERSRGPYYYYGGRNSLPLHVAEINGSVSRGSLSILEAPTPAHFSSKTRDHDSIQAKVIIVHTSEEEEIRARIRAFSGPSSVYSPPASPLSAYSRTESPMHPNTVLTND
jgi:hypothetical protein